MIGRWRGFAGLPKNNPPAIPRRSRAGCIRCRVSHIRISSWHGARDRHRAAVGRCSSSLRRATRGAASRPAGGRSRSSIRNARLAHRVPDLIQLFRFLQRCLVFPPVRKIHGLPGVDVLAIGAVEGEHFVDGFAFRKTEAVGDGLCVRPNRDAGGEAGSDPTENLPGGRV